MTRHIPLFCLILPVLAACGSAPTPAADPSGSVPADPTVDEENCLLEVTVVSQNPDVYLLGSDESEAGTLVRVGVGPDQTPWQCISYSDGSTADVRPVGGTVAL